LYLLVKGLEFLGWFVKFAIRTDCNPFLAERAIAEIEENTRS
jgi:hypothetical protein